MKNKNLWLVVGVVVIIATVIVGVRLTEKSNGRVFKATAILPLTGNTAVIGQEERDGMRMAIEDYNLKVFSLDLKFEDFAGDAKQAVSAYQKTISIDKPIAIFASTSTAVNALLPLAKETPNINFFAITTQKNVIVSENVFRVWPSVTQEVNLLIEYLNLHFDKSIAFMHPTNELGLNVEEALTNSVGNRIIIKLPHSLSSADFRDDLEKIRSQPNSKNLILVAWTYPTQTLNILKRIDELKLSFFSIVTSIGTDFPPVLEYLKTSNLQPIFAVPQYDVSARRKDFEQRFSAKYGYSPNWNVAAAYDNATFLLHTLDRCTSKSDMEIVACMRQASKQIEFEGISGLIRLQKPGEAEIPMVLVTFDKQSGIIQYEH